jgi:hypothetical protein
MKEYAAIEKEIMDGARPGCTMNEADPYGVILEKKLANLIKSKSMANAA